MTSIIDRLDTDIRIPYDEAVLKSGDPVLIAEYILDLVKTLQDLLERIVIAANFTIDAFDGEAVYYGMKNSLNEYPDGTWRRIQVGNNLEDQVKIDSAWVTAHTRERPV